MAPASTPSAGQARTTTRQPTGSVTTTTTQAPDVPQAFVPVTLRLRVEPVEERHIQWAEDVIDNEGMGKKSSKVCCIYHKPHAVDESSGSDSSDSSSDSDSDSEPDNSTARPVGGSRRGRKGHHHHHDHGDGDGDGCGGGSEGKGKGKARKRSPNAYEKQPKYGGSKKA
ncbi:Type 1 phosphatases regulator ypi1 [Coniosporium apollinis]|uniref:Type 1 phosphatases regulator n=2 Tax=Coniosporium TaxID=2810619 RepID=A0ABQ9NQH9_9PEZI|nr:Type 1 phosphatases regulator ypi1 [Cladosporium sp. JES 115]KAJ9661853.1 Type 1 phosphatases regulator ypi1 [Coniosporium apollinis]